MSYCWSSIKRFFGRVFNFWASHEWLTKLLDGNIHVSWFFEFLSGTSYLKLLEKRKRIKVFPTDRVQSDVFIYITVFGQPHSRQSLRQPSCRQLAELLYTNKVYLQFIDEHCRVFLRCSLHRSIQWVSTVLIKVN